MTPDEAQELKEQQDREARKEELQKEIELGEAPLYEATARGYDNIKTREVGERFRYAGEPGKWMKEIKPGKKSAKKEELTKGGELLASSKVDPKLQHDKSHDEIAAQGEHVLAAKPQPAPHKVADQGKPAKDESKLDVL